MPVRAADGTRRAQSGRTERRLIQTATLLFSERGFHGTSIRDIADAAEVAVSAMYYYAKSKDEVLLAIMRRGLDRLEQGSRQALETVEGSSERLATLIGAHVALHARNPRTAMVIDHEYGAVPAKARKEILGRRDAYEAIWEAELRAGVRTGEFADRGPLARLALLEMCTGVAHWYKPQGQLKIPQVCDRFADMGLALVSATRDGEPVTLERLALADSERLVPLVEIDTEPRRGRSA